MSIDESVAPDLPLVSVIMPAYNAARYLEQAVRSVMAQTYPNWELLIINDASTDNTSTLAADLADRDPRIRILEQSRNQGVSAARNRGLDSAEGEYIAFLDSDDLWEPEKLAVQIQFMKKSGLLICYSSYHRINGSGELLGTVRVPDRVDYKAMLKTNHIGNLTGIYNARALGKQYFTQFKHEDYVAWLELLKKGRSAGAAKGPLARYRVAGDSVSANKLRTIAWQWRIYRQSQYLNPVASIWYMGFYAINALKKRLN